MFNIYYINYAKAYEIAMLLDNKITEEITKWKLRFMIRRGRITK